MILFEITRSEAHEAYKRMAIANSNRHYDFLRSAVLAAIETNRPFLSQTVLKALNFHAIACLHTHAGEYRPCPVHVGTHRPPEHFQVIPLMDDFVNTVNRSWDQLDPVVLASFVLWRLNYIHPFINGNGRTARAACYFVLCLAGGNWLRGDPILPELLHQHRDEYVEALRLADVGFEATGQPDLGRLHAMVQRLLAEQLASIPEDADEDVEEEAPEGDAERPSPNEGPAVAP